jgi:hypothetical protein
MSLIFTRAAGIGIGTAIGAGVGTLESKLGGASSGDVKFYYMSSAGGKVINVIARKAAQIAAGIAKDEVDSLIHKGADALRKLIGGNKSKNGVRGATWAESAAEKAREEQSKYGQLHDVSAYDDYGNVCYESVMLAIPITPAISHSALTYCGDALPDGTNGKRTVTNNWLVWYDTVGLVNVSSDKNVVLTQVAGRDYSRKELVSNGDVKFSVTGHITSSLPDCYPNEEVQKFREIMRYRGIVEVNNVIFDQWGIKYVVITGFNMPTQEGSKSVQDYSFECVGIQPDEEANVTEDAIQVHDLDRSVASPSKKGGWVDMLKNTAIGAVSSMEDMATQGTALATGMLNKL